MKHTLIDVMLSLDALCVQYSVELVPEKAAEFFRRAPIFNEMVGMETFVDRVTAVIPGRSFLFRVGNEYSRVVYVEVIKLYLPADFDYRDLTARLDDIAIACGAQEHGVTKDAEHSYAFRFWWD